MSLRLSPIAFVLLLSSCGAAPSEGAVGDPARGDSSSGDESEPAAEAAPEEQPPPTELCASRADDEEEVIGCSLRPGRTMPNGVRVDVLEVETDWEGREFTTTCYLVFRDADTTQFEPLIASGNDGNGEQWTTAEVGELGGEGGHLEVEATRSSFLRGCTGDPSCFEDDSNVSRVSQSGVRMSCVPRAEVPDGEFEPGYDDDGEEIAVLYVCAIEEFDVPE